MPDEVYNEIIGVPGGGKAKGIDPILQQQDAQTTGVGKEQAGIAPELRQNNAVAVSPATAVAVPQPQVSIQNTEKPALAGPPPQPKTMTYAEMITRLSPYAPPSQEELEKERKREKREKLWSAIGDGLAAVTDLAFAGSSGFSNYDPKNSMSARAEARWDKLRKEREDNSQRWLSLYMNARSHDDAAERWKKDFEYRAARDKERADEESRRWQAQFEYKKEQDEEAMRQWQATFDQKAEQIQFENDLAKKNYVLASRRLAAQNGGDVDFLIGDNERITVPKSSLNSANITYLFNTLPKSIRDQQHGTPVINNMGVQSRDANGKPIFNQLTSDEMLTVIFSNITGAPETQNALRQLAGQKTTPAKPKLF